MSHNSASLTAKQAPWWQPTAIVDRFVPTWFRIQPEGRKSSGTLHAAKPNTRKKSLRIPPPLASGATNRTSDKVSGLRQSPSKRAQAHSPQSTHLPQASRTARLFSSKRGQGDKAKRSALFNAIFHRMDNGQDVIEQELISEGHDPYLVRTLGKTMVAVIEDKLVLQGRVLN